MYELHIGGTSTGQSSQKKNYHLYHAPERHGGNDHPVFGRQAVEQSRALVFQPAGYLPTDFIPFPFQYPSGFLADGDFA